MIKYLLVLLSILSISAVTKAQCLYNWNVSVSTPPVNGTYACGQTVTFCITINGWSQPSSNWFHGVTANFGPGWNMASVVPGPMPAACSGFGTWGYYNSVQGSSYTNIGPQGPGFFFDQNNDGNPGNNYGDNCLGSSNWQFCWTVSVQTGAGCVNGTSLSVTFDTFSDSQTGAWVINACGSDPIVPAPPAVIGASCTLNAGTNGTLSLCSTSSASTLFGSLGGTPDIGGAWTAPNGTVFNGTFVPGTSVPGTYTYTVSSTSPPCSESATVTVSVIEQPSAGTNGSITLCASEAPFNLFDQLGGSPTTGGTWTNSTGSAQSATFDPAVLGSTICTYTIPAAAPCAAVSATVQVDVIPSPNAGSSGSITVCSSDPAITLIDALGGSPASNGTWTAPGGTAFGAQYLPGSSNPGTYTYTVAGTAPCPASSATLTISENLQPNAGAMGADSYCIGDPVVDLFSLLEGSPQAGGTWTNSSGSVVSSTLDPQNAQTDTFIYTVNGQAPCTDASAPVMISIIPSASAGIDASISLCSTSGATPLFPVLGGDPDTGGTWSGPGGNSGTFQAGTSPAGVYTYTVSGISPCPNSSATVTVTVIDQASAGVSGTATLCETGPPVPLLPILGNTAANNGTWTAPDGTTFTGTLNPSTAAAGAYTYTVTSPAPCLSAQAVVDVNINTQSSAGTNGALSLCSESDAVQLSTLLGGTPDPGGAWSGPSTLSGGIFTPGVNAPGVYTYSTPSLAPCTTATATVTMSVSAQPDAGLDGSASLCSATTQPFDLFSALNGSPDVGGIWTAPSGQTISSALTPSSATSGTYTYAINVAAPCVSVSSAVEITVIAAPQAGSGGQVALCENGIAVDPFTWLSGTFSSDGTWAAPDGSIVTTVDPTIAGPGNYVYTVPGTTPCPAALATVVLSIDELPSAGQDASLSLCADASSFDLFTLLGNSADTGGNWSGPNGTTSGTFTPGSSPAGSYTYTTQGAGACVGNTATAVVQTTVLPLPAPSFTLDPQHGCVPLAVGFANTTPGSLQSVSWNFGDGGTSVSPDPEHIYTSVGNFAVTLSVVDQNGCSADLTLAQAVFVSGGPSAIFTAGPLRVNENNPTFQVNHSPVADVVYDWSLDGAPIQGSESFSYTFAPPALGAHLLCLLATDTLGCANELCTTITVIDDIAIHVPNAFTPDGDGVNDIFSPALLSVDTEGYLFVVFDRWGAEVFSTTIPGEAWNGGYKNQGETLRTGVYVWRVYAKDPFSADRKELIGSVTLLK